MYLRNLIGVAIGLLLSTLLTEVGYTNDECVDHSALKTTSDVSKLAKTIDYIGANHKVAKPGKNITRFGTTLGKSCSANGPEQTKAYVERLNQALAITFRQLDLCKKVFRFQELDDAIALLRRANVECASSGNYQTSGGTADLNSKVGLQVTIEINPSNMANNVRVLAHLLFHEVLHYLPANNKDLSIHNKAKSRNFDGCLDSVFDDRIYFIQSSCFPSIGLKYDTFNDKDGGLFLSKTPPFKCTGLCEKAFSTIPSEHDKETIYKSTSAIPYSKNQVKATCDRIRNTGERQRKYLAYRDDLMMGWSKSHDLIIGKSFPVYKDTRMALHKVLDKLAALVNEAATKENQELSDTLVSQKLLLEKKLKELRSNNKISDPDFFEFMDDFRSAADIAADTVTSKASEKDIALLKIGRIKSKIALKLQSVCPESKHPTHTWYFICSNKGDVVLSQIAAYEAKLQELTANDVLIQNLFENKEFD